MTKFSEKHKIAAWNNASAPPEGYDKKLYRLDSCGAIIYWSSYGKDTNMGWEVDHIFPESKGGKDDHVNLRAMQHQNNSTKGDNYPSYDCAVRMKGTGDVTSRTVHVNTRKKLAKLYGKKAE
jgi:hypothetical protein